MIGLLAQKQKKKKKKRKKRIWCTKWRPRCRWSSASKAGASAYADKSNGSSGDINNNNKNKVNNKHSAGSVPQMTKSRLNRGRDLPTNEQTVCQRVELVDDCYVAVIGPPKMDLNCAFCAWRSIRSARSEWFARNKCTNARSCPGKCKKK